MNHQNQSSSVTPELATAWVTLQDHALLRPIRNDAEYERLHALADDLSDVVGDDEDHPLSSLFELAMELIQKWEDQNVIIPDLEPRELLRHLLEENGLKQSDLLDIATASHISDILTGRREISKAVAKKLAQKFAVGIEVFL